MKEIFSNYGFEIVVGMIFFALATIFSRVIYFGYFNKKGQLDKKEVMQR